MNLLRKTFDFDELEKLSVEFIENFMRSLGFKPLRWAVVRIKENSFTVESVVIPIIKSL